MIIHKLASAVYNDVVGGLGGITSNPAMSMEQLEDDVVNERLLIIKEYSVKGLLPIKDLIQSVPCIQVDCKSIDKCCTTPSYSKPSAHFEVPQLANDFGEQGIQYLGSVNQQIPFKVYLDHQFKYHNLKITGKHRPFVYIDTTPNENNMYDGWIFNAPLLEQLSITAVFKDPRQLDNYACCQEDSENFSFIHSDIIKRLTEKKLRYYRQFLATPTPNTQAPK